MSEVEWEDTEETVTTHTHTHTLVCSSVPVGTFHLLSFPTCLTQTLTFNLIVT